MKEKIKRVDREAVLVKCREPRIARVEVGVGWRRLWSEQLEYNNKTSHTRGLQWLSRLMSHHGS